MAVGVSDDPIGRRLAQEKANRIYLDLVSGNFDRTLSKYRSDRVESLAITDLAEAYAKARTSEVGVQTQESWRMAFAFLRKMGIAHRMASEIDAAIALKVGDSLRKGRSPETAKKYLTIYAAVWDWAIESRWAKENPWRSEAAKVRLSAPPPPNIYSRDEVARILDGFANYPNARIRSYWPLAVFLLSTGCRPGEAFALRWQNVSADGRRVWIGEAVERGGAIKETKTREARWIELNRTCRAAILSLRQEKKPKPSDLVFTGSLGATLNTRNWRRIWEKVLLVAGVSYRPPYLSRHTVASHALDSGYAATEVAEQLGNLPKTLLDRYAGATQRRAFPDLLDPAPLPPDEPDENRYTS